MQTTSSQSSYSILEFVNYNVLLTKKYFAFYCEICLRHRLQDDPITDH